MIFFYNIFRLFFKSGISIAAGWNSKAEKWVAGRKNWQNELSLNWNTETGNPVIWIHCASLGEFEQGRPIIEKLKSEIPSSRILLTFFSPSGYEIRKNYEKADYVMYLPFDSKKNAAVFLNKIKPQLAIFVKYEFWHYFLQELKERKIETILVSGIFRSSQPFFKWWGSFHRNMLNNFSHLFVQNKESKELLTGIGLAEQTTVAGDTRFDRVLASVQQWKPVDHLDLFCADCFTVVAGSTWPEDEAIMSEFINGEQANQKLVIAPHEIKDENIARLKKLFPDSILFSEMNESPSAAFHQKVLIINNIGYLSRLYRYATVCYVGGGFNKSGHHNILEAAVFGKPVITGPNFHKFKESVDLKNSGGSFTVNNCTELKQVLSAMNIEAAGKIAENYVKENGGATDTIFKRIQEKRLFTKA